MSYLVAEAMRALLPEMAGSWTGVLAFVSSRVRGENIMLRARRSHLPP
ncbi:hypothetical protein [Denitrobaculum tricleocarpae]|nr:hypothetical protein [Denitrobaculum tricleocarpae]